MPGWKCAVCEGVAGDPSSPFTANSPKPGIARALLLGYFRFCGLNDRAPWAINCPARFP
jgi:hypothetical protein